MRLRLLAALVTLAALVGGVVVSRVAPADETSAPADDAATLAAPASPQPAAPAPSPPPPPEPPDYDELQERLERILEDPGLALTTANVGVAVRDAEGWPVVDLHSGAALLPASTQKLVTAAAALLTFGPEHRFVTTVGGAAEPRDGRLVGDLVLTGSGDPVLATGQYEKHVYTVRPRTPMEHLADQLVAAGITEITGDVVGDASMLGGPDRAPGWKDEYFWDFDARHIRGLTVDAGLTVEIEGEGPSAEVTLQQADDPPAHAAATLIRLLRERGVTVRGVARSSQTSVPAPELLASVHSPPLRELLRHTVQRSDNPLADTLFRLVGAARGGDGSWASGAEAARDILADLGIDLTGTRFADGSGLSRDNRVTAAFLAELDAAMGSGEFADAWRALMAVAGETGTLRHRLKGTLAQGAFLGKTGTLDDVSAVAGVVRGPGGGDFHVAVVGNQTGAEKWTIRVLMDELVLALAEEQRGCTRVPAPAVAGSEQPSEEPHVAPYALNCP